MKKRLKKKRNLETKVAELAAENALLRDVVGQQAVAIADLQSKASATAVRFDEIETTQNVLLDDIVNIRLDIKRNNKPWFKRK